MRNNIETIRCFLCGGKGSLYIVVFSQSPANMNTFIRQDVGNMSNSCPACNGKGQLEIYKKNKA